MTELTTAEIIREAQEIRKLLAHNLNRAMLMKDHISSEGYEYAVHHYTRRVEAMDALIEMIASTPTRRSLFEAMMAPAAAVLSDITGGRI